VNRNTPIGFASLPGGACAKDDPRYRVEVRYIDIVDERRVVWTETLREPDTMLRD
jgi:hypothetical protein